MALEDLQAKKWPKANHGKLRKDDSYIVLNTTEHPESGKLLHVIIYFWLGQGTTADGMGAAMFEVVELDNFLDGELIQRREVRGYESHEFLKLFFDSPSYGKSLIRRAEDTDQGMLGFPVMHRHRFGLDTLVWYGGLPTQGRRSCC